MNTQIPQLSEDALKARKRRSLMTALALVAFVVLVFFITIAKLGENAGEITSARDMSNAVAGEQSAPAAPAVPAPQEGEGGGT